MAEKLSVQIALEGGEEVERQLASMGKAGQKAFAEIEQAATKVGGFKNLKPDEVTNKLKDMGVTGVESINKIQAAVQTAGRYENLVLGVRTVEAALVKVGQAAAVAGVALGAIGAAAAVGLAAALKSTIGFAQAINKTSAEAIKLGMSFKNFDNLKLTMERGGMSAEAVSSGISKIKENIDKIELTKIKTLFQDLAKAEKLGIRFAPGQGPGKEIQAALTKIGPAGDFAREALRKFNEEVQKSGNIRFAPGVVPTLDQLKTNIDPVQAAMSQLGITATTAAGQYEQITTKLSAMTDVAERNRLALLLLGETAGTAFIQSLPGADAQEAAANKLVASINQLTAEWNRFGSVTFAPTITAGIDSITASLKALNGLMAGFSWEAFGAAGKAAFDLITNAASAFTLQGMLSWIARAVIAWTGLIDLVKRAMGAMSSGAGGPPLSDTGDVSGYASGGLLGGRGTGTSDSNLAWVSRGEHIMPARAVQQPGVLAFLEALRRSGGNLSRVLDGMGRFALGGMVPHRMGIPAYAAGGPVGSMSNVTIQFPGVPPIGGLRASSEVVDQLHKAAALAQVRSGGRKPSRYS